MKTKANRPKLHQLLETAEEKKAKALSALSDDETTQENWEYTEEFKKELESRHSHYINGGKMVSASDANKQIFFLLSQP